MSESSVIAELAEHIGTTNVLDLLNEAARRIIQLRANLAAAELAQLKDDFAQTESELSYEVKQNAQLRAENAEMLEALERHVEWLENVDHDYSNGNSACGCDEGAVLGQRGESQLLASSHTILAKHTMFRTTGDTI